MTKQLLVKVIDGHLQPVIKVLELMNHCFGLCPVTRLPDPYSISPGPPASTFGNLHRWPMYLKITHKEHPHKVSFKHNLHLIKVRLYMHNLSIHFFYTDENNRMKTNVRESKRMCFSGNGSICTTNKMYD